MSRAKLISFVEKRLARRHREVCREPKNRQILLKALIMNTVALRTALSARIGNNAPNVMTVTHCRTGCALIAVLLTSGTGRVRNVTNTAARMPNATAAIHSLTRHSENAGWNAMSISIWIPPILAGTVPQVKLPPADGLPIRPTAILATAFPWTAAGVRNVKTVPAPKRNVKTAMCWIRWEERALPRLHRA